MEETKKPAVFLGDQMEGSSMELVALQISALTDARICRTPAELLGASVVINLLPEEVVTLLKARRFAGYDRLVQFLASNIDEFADHELAPMLVALATDKMDGLILHSDWSLRRLKAALSTHYTPSARVAVLNRTQVSLWGVSDEFHYTTKGRLPNKWVAPFNRINRVYKGIDLHHEVMGKVRAATPDFECLFIFCGMKSRGNTDFPNYTIVPQGTREEYVQLIASSGAFLCTSKTESFGIYYLELLKSGLVGVFQDKEWVRLLLPDYPLIFPAYELPTACLMVSKDLPRFQTVVKNYIDAQFQHFSMDEVGLRLRAVLSL